MEFSALQQQTLFWWSHHAPHAAKEGIICDGAVRSGKTFCLAISFILWSFACHRGQTFAFCCKTIGAVQRNILSPLFGVLDTLGITHHMQERQNRLTLEWQGNKHTYYLFGGKDRGSAAMIQGMTLAGVFFDEVVLMPETFVMQAIARCSVERSKLWFNCNPQAPTHWFYKNWICKKEEKQLLYLHFTMLDNPTLSAEMRARYHNLYHGAFYQRYILGRWSKAEGLIYPMFGKIHLVKEHPNDLERFVVSCDYGTVNPTSCGLWGYSAKKSAWVRISEYYYDSHTEGTVRTDRQHVAAIRQWLGDTVPECMVVDPSAASFIACLLQERIAPVITADNRVLPGIQCVMECLQAGTLKVHTSCTHIIGEFAEYSWDTRANKEAPCKQHDHAMDDMRYAAMYLYGSTPKTPFAAHTVRR